MPQRPGLSAYHPSLGERITQGIASGLGYLGVNPRYANHVAGRAFGFLNDLTPVGNATMAADAGTAIRQKQYAKGAGLGALAILPGAAPKILKKSGIRAYHVSPHNFDKFDMSKLGTGEGAQRYGRGLYFATKPDGPTVQHYRKFFGEKSKTYEAQINVAPEQLLNWDMPAWEQPDNVKNMMRQVGMPTEAPLPRVRQTKSGRFTALNQWGESIGTFPTEERASAASMQRLREALGGESGGLLYSRLGGNLYYPHLDDGRATAALRDAGVLGARWLTPVGDENLAIFDDGLIDILNKF